MEQKGNSNSLLFPSLIVDHNLLSLDKNCMQLKRAQGLQAQLRSHFHVSKQGATQTMLICLLQLLPLLDSFMKHSNNPQLLHGTHHWRCGLLTSVHHFFCGTCVFTEPGVCQLGSLLNITTANIAVKQKL